MLGFRLLMITTFLFAAFSGQCQQATEIVQQYLLRSGANNMLGWRSVRYHGVSLRALRPMNFRYWIEHKNRFRVEVDMGGSSTFVQAFDGGRAWEINPYAALEGPAWLPEDRQAVMQHAFAWARLAVLARNGNQFRYVGETLHQAKSAHHIRLVTPDSVATDFYFDRNTYELVKYSEWAYTVAGTRVLAEVVPADYKLTHGVMLPYTFSYSVNGQHVKKDSVLAYAINVAVDVTYPAHLPNTPKTFGFDPNHPSEKKLLASTLPVTTGSARPLTDADGRLLKPVTLTYRGVHKGLHADWEYDLTYSILPHNEQPVPFWVVSSGLASTSRTETAATRVAYQTLALNEDHAGFYEGDFTYTVTNDSIVMSAANRWTGEAVRITLPNQPEIFTSGRLDVYLQALPLKRGYERDFIWLYGRTPRPFRLRVAGTERVTTRAGKFDTFILELIPRDGKKELQSVYYVQQQAPHIIIKKKYVVFPETLSNNMPKSMGNEDLVSIEWLPAKP